MRMPSSDFVERLNAEIADADAKAVSPCTMVGSDGKHQWNGHIGTLSGKPVYNCVCGAQTARPVRKPE